MVPDAVADEIRKRGAQDPTVQAMDAADWLDPVAVGARPAEVERWDLGPGESAVLAWAFSHPGTTAIVVEELRASGMYLSDAVVDAALELVGE